jgi:hypothetical protein
MFGRIREEAVKDRIDENEAEHERGRSAKPSSAHTMLIHPD